MSITRYMKNYKSDSDPLVSFILVVVVAGLIALISGGLGPIYSSPEGYTAGTENTQ